MRNFNVFLKMIINILIFYFHFSLDYLLKKNFMNEKNIY